MIKSEILKVTSSPTGYFVVEHGFGTKPDSLLPAVVEDPTAPGPVAALVTSWDDQYVTGLTLFRDSGDPAEVRELEVRFDAAVVG